jgi:Mg-chelatase subunit ChlD
MNQTCSRCGTSHDPQARFCQVCGATLGATAVDGRTVVANASPPSSVPARPQFDIKTIVQRAQKALGNTVLSPQASSCRRADQRELTVFVDDISVSMSEDYDGTMSKLEAAIRANINMVLEKDKIDPQDEIGLVAFDNHAHTILPLTPISTHKRQIIEALQSLSIGGGTDINEGVKAGGKLFDWQRPDVVRRMVLLTDGHGGHPIRTAQDLKDRGVVIDVIGVGPDPSAVDEKLLRRVASVIEGEVRYRFIKDQHTLVAHYTRLAGKTAVSA